MKALENVEGPFLEDCDNPACRSKHFGLMVDSALFGSDVLLCLQVTAGPEGLLVDIGTEDSASPLAVSLSRKEAFAIASSIMEAVELIDELTGVEH